MLATFVPDFLPGLWVLALCWLLVWALNRWFDRVSWIHSAVYLSILVALFGRVLFAGDSLLPLDNLRGEVPFRQLVATEPHGNPLQSDLLQLVAPAQAEVRRQLAHGRWPLWSSRMGAGMPLLADPQAQALQPLTLAAAVFPVAKAAGVTAALRVFLALLFTGLLLRRQALGEGAALVGSLAWGLGGFLILWLGWPLANSAAWLPAVLYAVARCQDRAGRRDGLLLSAVVSGLLLGGHPETVAYALALAGLFYFSRRRQSRRGLDADLTAAGSIALSPVSGGGRRVLGAALLALCLTSPALLPAVLYAPQSLRAARLAQDAVSALPAAGVRAVTRLVPLVAPNAFGNDRFVHYWGNDNINEDAAGFIGTVGLLLVALGGLRWLWRGMGRMGHRTGRAPPDPSDRLYPQEGLMWAVAGFCSLVVALPPGLPESLRRLPLGSSSGFHHRLLLPLGFSLVYLAVCELHRWQHRQRTGRRLQPLLALAAAGGALAVLLVWAYTTFVFPDDPALLEVFRWGWLRWQLRFLVASGALLWLAGWSRGRKDWLPYGLAVLVAMELLLIHRPANPPSPKRLAFPSPPPLAFLRQEVEQSPPGAGWRLLALDRALPANLASLYGLSDIRTAGPMAPNPVYQATASLITGWQGEAPVYGHPEHPLYDRLAVRWVLTPPEAVLPPPLEVALRHPSGWVWRRPQPRTRLFLTPAEPATRWRRGPHQGVAEGAASLESTVWRTSLDNSTPRRLDSSIYQDGGWRLLVDGRRQRSPATQSPFVSARLPAGSHQVALLYRPPGFLLGCLLAALGWTALLAAVLAPHSRRVATDQWVSDR